MDSVFYVRLDFGSGDFLHPWGDELFRENREMVQKVKEFAKSYEDSLLIGFDGQT